MAYSVEIKRSAEKDLDTIPDRARKRIIDRLLELALRPRPEGVRKLTNEEKYRIRVGDYRVLYEIFDAEKRVVVVAVGHRRDVYR